MLRLSNIRIGTKLAVMSGIGVLLVARMIAASIYSSSVVKSADDAAMKRQDILTAGDPAHHRPVSGQLRGAEGERQQDGRADRFDHRQHQDLHTRGHQRFRRNLHQHHRSVATHRGAGGKPGADLGVDGGNLRDREEERRKRASRPTNPPASAREVADRGGQIVAKAVEAMGHIEGPRARFPTSSGSSMRSRARPTCWR